MLILHAAQTQGGLALWAEASEPAASAPGQHPFCATHQLLENATDLDPEECLSQSAVAWLPSSKEAPLPSGPLAGPSPKSRSKLVIRPWSVPILRPSPEQTVLLLRKCHQQRVLKPGVAIGTDLAYWAQALRLAASLTARQQFLPALSQDQGRATARWTPAFTGDDARRMAELASAMPPPARALTGTEEAKPPSEAAQTVLADFMAGVVDHLARTSADPSKTQQKEIDSAHDAWLLALQHADPVLHGRPEQIAQLRRQVSEWQRPIAIAANSPYRLCIRLEEPSEEGPAEALQQDDWYLRYLLQPHEDHSLLLPAGAVWRNQADLSHPEFNPAEFLLTSLAQAGSACPPINDSLKRKHPAGKTLNADEAHDFLEHQAAALQQAGIGVMLPTWWTRHGAKTKPVIRAKTKGPKMQGGSGLSMTSLIGLDVELALGDETISPEELDQLASLKVPLVRFRGQWVEINPDDIRAAAEYWRNRKELTLREIVQIGLGADRRAQDDNVRLSANDWLQELLEKLQEKARIETPETPEHFAGQLRPYQQLGYSWLTFLKGWGLGACLADDMGLGKTVQTLAALQLDHEQGNERPNLLVCPTSVINNWQREAAKFTPDLPTMVHHGPSRQQGESFRKQAGAHQVVITSYGTMTRDEELLASVPWRAIVLDEAQNIKNPDTRQAKAARALPAEHRIALSGTPVENHVGDLWSIMQFLNPGLLGTQAEFKRNYFQPIQADRDQAATDRLQKATGPFILRRLKTDRSIIDDLPEKNETKQYCNLTKEQATLYEAVLREAETRLESAEGMARRGSILDTLTKLKQACNHPRHLLGDNSAVTGRSGKLSRLQELLDELLPPGDRVLLFTQFAEMGKILQQHIQETYGLETPFLHGGISRNQRDRMAERFQKDPNGPQVFVLSLKAGGTGLNLTRANHVIHYDRWWNPAVENQATDRAFRIGQTKDVHVHKLICAGTLEDRIDAMIEIKQETADQVVGTTSERWLTELSNAELRDVLALSATPAD